MWKVYIRKSNCDFIEGLRSWRLWVALAWKDIRLRYSRTVLGPFWQTISQSVFIGGLGFVFSQFWGVDIKHYLPFLAGGIITWSYITFLLTDGCSAFSAEAGIIKACKLPFSVHVYREVFRNLILLLHSVPIWVFMIVWADVKIDWSIFYIIPGILILTLNGVWCGFLLGLLAARFRDIPNIVGNIMMVMFFVTPIHWEPHMMTNRKPIIVHGNPFHHLLEIVRAPLLGQEIQSLSWLVSLGILFFGICFTYLIFTRFRARIPFWL
jgi:ABC-type polysaccharide/polyol phosphate export permease